MVYKRHNLSRNHFEVFDKPNDMKLYLLALLFGIALAGDDCRVKGVGPGYEKSYLDYAGKFRGGARKFLPIYRKEVAEEKEVVVKGGCGAKEEKEAEEKEPPREKRCSGGDGCHVKGVGPGYEKSYLDYAGKFRGGARKFLPIYRKVVAEEKEVVVKGGCGAKEEKEPEKKEPEEKEAEKKEPPRGKRCSGGKGHGGHDRIRGVGAGYAKSYLDYAGKFRGGARKFLPIYRKEVAEEKEVVVKGGWGAKEEKEPEEKEPEEKEPEKKEPPREKREAKGDDGHDCIKGVGAGYAKSYLDYAGKFRGGARKFVPIYKKVADLRRERAKGDDGHDCIKGVGAGYAKSYLDYAGKFRGGARKFVPIYKKVGSASKEVVIKGGAKCGEKH
ncbi:hypothetical protein M513_00368 [Trichuris suis]|uniref:Uncharacterized protein n=1 Tax=Trichuris suis TaxID=68888 RepID=A0A085MN79_9BILA|nr:hypothetical protein M513_00368 [Trichuris suis]